MRHGQISIASSLLPLEIGRIEFAYHYPGGPGHGPIGPPAALQLNAQFGAVELEAFPDQPGAHFTAQPARQFAVVICPLPAPTCGSTWFVRGRSIARRPRRHAVPASCRSRFSRPKNSPGTTTRKSSSAITRAKSSNYLSPWSDIQLEHRRRRATSLARMVRRPARRRPARPRVRRGVAFRP